MRIPSMVTVIGTVAVAISMAVAGCAEERTDLLLASTTSTEDSGLFEVLLPAFMRAHPEIDVNVTAVGSGQAMELGRRRDADVLLVHSPRAESTFVASGHGLGRCQVMYNDFVLVGPPADPAGVAEATGIDAALARIAASEAEFLSRGDDSGTHVRERRLWAEAGLHPAGDWYMEVGQGMAELLQMASERAAYALTDRATFVTQEPRLRLEVRFEGDDRLFNPYGVIPVTGARQPGAARAFARWVTSEEAQALIGEFGADRLGRPLFVPDAGRCPLPSA